MISAARTSRPISVRRRPLTPWLRRMDAGVRRVMTGTGRAYRCPGPGWGRSGAGTAGVAIGEADPGGHPGVWGPPVGAGR